LADSGAGEKIGEEVEVIRAECLAAFPHGFLGRRGGISNGIVSGLNVGFGAGDDSEAVQENRRRAVEAVLPGGRLVSVHQTHSAICAIANVPWSEAERPKADAIVTSQPGLVLGIVTADCAPVMLADGQAQVIGMVHAGWRGAHGGVLEAAIAAMESLGAVRGRILAAIGPAIGQQSYEVGDDFRRNFASADDRFFAPGRPGHHQFDLAGYIGARLGAAGIASVEQLGLDTYTQEERFYSYRRATHRDEPNYGRQFSLIGLPIAPYLRTCRKSAKMPVGIDSPLVYQPAQVGIGSRRKTCIRRTRRGLPERATGNGFSGFVAGNVRWRNRQARQD